MDEMSGERAAAVADIERQIAERGWEQVRTGDGCRWRQTRGSGVYMSADTVRIAQARARSMATGTGLLTKSRTGE